MSFACNVVCTLNRISCKDGNQDVIIFQLLTAISSIGMDANTFVFTIKTLVTAIRYIFVCICIQGRRKFWKSGGASGNVVGIICPRPLNWTHDLILPGWTFKKWCLSNFASQSFYGFIGTQKKYNFLIPVGRANRTRPFQSILKKWQNGTF